MGIMVGRRPICRAQPGGDTFCREHTDDCGRHGRSTRQRAARGSAVAMPVPGISCRCPVYDGVNIVLGDADATGRGPIDAAEGPYDRNYRARPASDPPDFVTALTTKGPLSTKRIIWATGAAKPTIEPYGNAKVFSISEHAVGSIDDLAQLLNNLEHNLTAFMVRGRPAEGIARHYTSRRLHPRTKSAGTIEPATIEPAAHHWIPLDLDSIDCPDWLDPVHEPDRTVEYVVSQLPEVFHGATCWWSFTSGQGIKPGIRIRLFFWADRALADWQLKAWLSGYPVDQSIFAPAQPVYVARPIFIGMPDPVPTRSGIWRGDRDAITPPTITKPRGYCSQRAIRPAKLEHLLWRRLRGLPRADRRP